MSNITPPFLSRTPPPLDDATPDDLDADAEQEIRSAKCESPRHFDVTVPNFDEHKANLENVSNKLEPEIKIEDDVPSESFAKFKLLEQDVVHPADQTVSPDDPADQTDLPVDPADQPVLSVNPADQTVLSVNPADQTVLPDHLADQNIFPVDTAHQTVSSVDPAEQTVVSAEPAEQDEDDFGDFEEADNNIIPVVGDSKQDSEWAANFEPPAEAGDAQESSHTVVKEDSDWAADFEQAAAAVDEQQPSISDRDLNWPAGFDDAANILAEDRETFSLAKLKNELDQLLCSSFPETTRPSCQESRRENLYIILGEDEDNCDKNCDKLLPADQTDQCKLWMSLHLIEESLALKYIFSDSSSFRRYAASLKVDVNLAKLRRPNLPAFAWHLGATALTPEKPADLSRPNDAQAVSAAQDHSKDNPPNSQFDWNTSGLSNPLAEGTINYSLLDLDYFGGDSQANSSNQQKTTSADKDLHIKFDSEPVNHTAIAQTINNNNNNNNLHNKVSNQQQSVIKKYDSNPNMNPNSMSSKREMSCESVNIVGHLPDLSFMLSPVLMFPVRDYGSENNS